MMLNTFKLFVQHSNDPNSSRPNICVLADRLLSLVSPDRSWCNRFQQYLKIFDTVCYQESVVYTSNVFQSLTQSSSDMFAYSHFYQLSQEPDNPLDEGFYHNNILLEAPIFRLQKQRVIPEIWISLLQRPILC